MPIEGPLKELGIHDVFQLLDLARKTGTLRVSSELRQNAGWVCFEKGAVVAASIQSNPRPLGALLLRAGKVDEADLARAAAMQAGGDPRRLGDILADIGAVSRRELDRQVRAQAEEVIFELMSWEEGYFSFQEGDHAGVAVESSLRIPTEALLMEAARRIDEWSRIESRVPHLGVVPSLVGPDEGGGMLDLVPFEWEVLAAVDGSRDLRTIADLLARSEFDVARIAFGLASAGVIVLVDPQKSPMRAVQSRELGTLVRRAEEHLGLGDVESARQAAEDVVATYPDDARGHLMLGRVWHAAGDYDDAVDALQNALRLDPLLAAARRQLGLALAAMGRFDEAADTWERWRRMTTRPPEEEALVPAMERLQAAVHLLASALRGRLD